MSTLTAQTCPKCSAPRPAGATDCPRCGVVFARAEAMQKRIEETAHDEPPVFEPPQTTLDAGHFATPEGVAALVRWRRFGAIASLLVGLGFAKLLSGTPFAGFVLFIQLASAGLGFLVAHGLSRRAGWGRVMEMVLAAIGLLMFPYGTALSAFTLYYLTRPGASLYFDALPGATASRADIDALADFRGAPSGRWIRNLVNVGIVLGIVGLLIVGMLGATIADMFTGTSKAYREVAGVWESVNNYATSTRGYPETQPIDSLAATMGGSIPTKDPWGRPLKYEKAVGTIRVGSAGPDGKWAMPSLADYPAPKTCDDIVWDGRSYVANK